MAAIPASRRILPSTAVFLLAVACAAPGKQVQLAPVQTAPADGSELQFSVIAPFTVAGAEVIEYEQGGLVVDLVDDARYCIDVFADDPAIRRALLAFEDRSDVRRDPAPPRFRITLDAVAKVSPHRASYRYVDEMVTVSSAAWYRSGRAQIFLNCPAPDLEWPIYRVSAVEAI